MKKNIGIIDAYTRITCGLSMLGIGIYNKNKFIITLGAMKTAEGITGFCPMYYYLDISTNNSGNILGILKGLIKKI